MIVLDTNVISEAMKPDSHPNVRAWFNEQALETLFLTTITVAEIQFGISSLSDGRRRDMFAQRFETVSRMFKNRILPFDIEAARCHAELAVKAKRYGRGFPAPDGYIAAIAVSCGFSIASRDTAPFLAADLDVINPWEI